MERWKPLLVLHLRAAAVWIRNKWDFRCLGVYPNQPSKTCEILPSLNNKSSFKMFLFSSICSCFFGNLFYWEKMMGFSLSVSTTDTLLWELEVQYLCYNFRKNMQVQSRPLQFICVSSSLIYCSFWFVVVFICANTILQSWQQIQDKMCVSFIRVTAYRLTRKLIYQLQFVQMDPYVCAQGPGFQWLEASDFDGLKFWLSHLR